MYVRNKTTHMLPTSTHTEANQLISGLHQPTPISEQIAGYALSLRGVSLFRQPAHPIIILYLYSPVLYSLSIIFQLNSRPLQALGPQEPLCTVFPSLTRYITVGPLIHAHAHANAHPLPSHSSSSTSNRWVPHLPFCACHDKWACCCCPSCRAVGAAVLLALLFLWILSFVRPWPVLPPLFHTLTALSLPCA
jgi:hypothetical protein